jgi:hypothetical protein
VTGLPTTDLICEINIAFPGSADQTYTCTFDNVEKSRFKVKKLTDGVVKDAKQWDFELYEGPHGEDDGSFLGVDVLASDTSLGKTDGWMYFDYYNLNPFQTYTFCETNAPSGWASIWAVDLDGNGSFETIITPYNPNRNDDTDGDGQPGPGEDLGNRCVDFGAGTPYALTPGVSLAFQVDNRFPGGEPRTPGYWKNWTYPECSGGNQYYTATNNSDDIDEDGVITAYDRVYSGWALLDDVVALNAIYVGDLAIDGCSVGVSILDQRDIDSGKKMASDAAYTLAMHLLAAELNFGAGAESCQEALDYALDAQNLLESIGFDGTGKYLRPKDAEYGQALDLAYWLDEYNNGNLCEP